MSIGNFLRRVCSTRDERGQKTSDWFRLLVRRAVRSMVSDYASPVLDAGGGDGLLFDPLVSPLADATIILDLDTKALGEARLWYGSTVKVVSGDLTDMPFTDGAFNIAVCIGTFYNFPDTDMIRQGLKELARVTEKRGRVIVEFRNAGNPVVSLAYRYAEKYDPSLKGLPLNAYSIKQVKSMLSQAGLEVIRVKIIGIPLKKLAVSYIFEAVHQECEKDIL